MSAITCGASDIPDCESVIVDPDASEDAPPGYRPPRLYRGIVWSDFVDRMAQVNGCAEGECNRPRSSNGCGSCCGCLGGCTRWYMEQGEELGDERSIDG